MSAQRMPGVGEPWKAGPCGRLDKLLKIAGLSNVKIGKALGVHNASVSRWRSGENTPNADVLAAILELCDGSADEVLGLRPAVVDRAALERAVGLVEEVLASAAGAADKRRR